MKIVHGACAVALFFFVALHRLTLHWTQPWLYITAFYALSWLPLSASVAELRDQPHRPVHTTACKRLFSLGCVPHTDGAVFQWNQTFQADIEQTVLKMVEDTEDADARLSVCDSGTQRHRCEERSPARKDAYKRSCSPSNRR